MQTIGVEEIRTHYGSGAGRHWFDPSTMRFFGTRLSQTAYRSATEPVAYFVTSEQPPSGPRYWSVSEYNYETRDIETVGGHRVTYRSHGAAHRVARRLAEHKES